MRATRALQNLCTGVQCTMKLNYSVLKPRWLWIGATDMCNSRCEYCNIHLKKPTVNPLSPDEFRQILQDPLFKDVTYLLNSGGEPTVRRDLLDVLLAEHEAQPNATIQLSTNGLLPDKAIQIAEEMIQRKIKFEVGISLDGIGKEHDAIRGVEGNFEKVDYLVKKLLEMKVTVSLGSTLTIKNIENNIHARDYAKKLNVPFMFHWFNTSDFYGNDNSERSATYRKTAAMIQAVESTTPAGLYRDMWVNELNGVQQKFRCFALNTFAVLKCNGDIAPCLSMWDNTIGNVRNENPTSVWESQKAQDIRKTIKQCVGCLNNWGVCWSLNSMYYPNLIHKAKRLFQSKTARKVT